MRGARYLSKFDLESGYHQVLIKKEGVIDTVGKTTVFEHFRKRNMEKDKKKEERREKRERE